MRLGVNSPALQIFDFRTFSYVSGYLLVCTRRDNPPAFDSQGLGGAIHRIEGDHLSVLETEVTGLWKNGSTKGYLIQSEKKGGENVQYRMGNPA